MESTQSNDDRRQLLKVFNDEFVEAIKNSKPLPVMQSTAEFFRRKMKEGEARQKFLDSIFGINRDEPLEKRANKVEDEEAID